MTVGTNPMPGIVNVRIRAAEGVARVGREVQPLVGQAVGQVGAGLWGAVFGRR